MQHPAKLVLCAPVAFLVVICGIPAYGASVDPRPVLDRYCVGCHNEKAKTPRVPLTNSAVRSPGEKPEVWEQVVTKLKHRHMPPLGMPRPSEAEYDEVISSLVSTLDRASANPGRTATFRRLTQFEYRNAIRDLLALDIDVSSLLPADQASHGFDNITVGDLSPTLLERYLAAAQKISRLAVAAPVRSPGGNTIMVPPDLTQEDRLDGLPFGTRGGAVIPYTFPVDGTYEIQLRLARDRDERVEGLNGTHQLDLMLDGNRLDSFTITQVSRAEHHSVIDKDFKVRVSIKAGPHAISVAFVKKTSALVESERQPYQAHFNADRHPRLQPALYSVSVTGPYEASRAVDTPSRRKLFVCYPTKPTEEDSCAKRILQTFMKQAYRRPVADADLETPLAFFKEARANGGFDSGIEMAIRALLVNPQFLFRIEKDPAGITPNTAYRISDLELASRLSFLLWSSIPDDELLDLASRRKLSDPAVLERQVRRMLADRRSESLVTNFASQWLYVRNLATINPDPRLFPDFDDNLRQAFRRETEMFVDSIIREDRSVLDLLQANYTFVNERLAKHYGVPNVYGSRFRRIDFDKNSGRGGLLGQGSVLTVTSYATRTSPVLRGKWILDNLLGTPPAPPPPLVPQLKEGVESGKVLTMRELVAKHRANPACAGCHNLMDPIGFALEQFDAIGRSRTRDSGSPIDATGNLPDGSRFDGASELQKALLKRPDLFVSTLTEKLLIYALGRGVEPYDAPAIRKIVRNSKAADFRFSAVILGIVNSTPFQMRSSL